MSKDRISPDTDQPITYRWRSFGAHTWIYDPEPEWLEDHKFEVEWEPVYGAPQRPGVAQTPDLRGALESALEYVEADLRARFSVSGQNVRDEIRAALAASSTNRAADTPESVAAEVAYFNEHAGRFAEAHKGIAAAASPESSPDRTCDCNSPLIVMQPDGATKCGKCGLPE